MKSVLSILAVTILCLVCFRLGYRKGLNGRVVVTDVEYVHHYDTIVNEIPVPHIEWREVPVDVDTAAILEAYFQEARYNDTIQGSSVSLHIQDVISQNRLIDRVVTLNERIPVVRHNALVVSSVVGRNCASLLAGIRHKSMTWQAGYDFYNRGLVIGFSKEVWAW